LREKDTDVLKTLLDFLTRVNRMRVVKIQAARRESPVVKSIFFEDDLCAKAKPGQFLMVWVPGVDEIPLSLSSIPPSKGLSSVTVAEIGEATKALNQKDIGDVIGIRGPFGSNFEAIGEKALVVGGGMGTVPLMPLIEKLVEERSSVTILLGANTKTELISFERLEEIARNDVDLIVTTDDGSYGLKGIATDPLSKVLDSERFDMVYGCGPEKMIHRVYSLTEQYNIPLQASLERIMRCAIGICGSCVIGKYRVCRDGPVFTSDQLREVELEFGRFKHDFSGKRIPV